METGQMTIDVAGCSSCRIVTEVAALMRVRAASKNLSLDVTYVFPVPETIRSDALRIRQILMNLIGNAIKFTEAGSVRLLVRFNPDGSDDSDGRPLIHFDVVDTGIGMSPEQMRHLFQPFSQVDASAARRFGGTGLGLTISKRLAELLGGSITVKSTPGKGSTFTLTIPTGELDHIRMISEPSEAFAAAQEPEGECAPPEVRMNGRILLAEDGPDNQRLISFFLRKAGLDVEVAATGRAAVDEVMAEQHGEQPFDMILMDMQMPVMDGYEATMELRRRDFRDPIIALTAHSMSGDREKCIKAGCDDYLTKPIDRAQLLRTIARFLAAPADRAA